MKLLFDVDELFAEKTLVPAIIQDNATLRVLMLGYMNFESLNKTIETGLATFFSRTRQKLWTKGESSGNFLKVIEIRVDCDCDTLLVKVDMVGPVCHTGSTSCFKTDDSEGFLGKLESIIASRYREMPSSSYTAHLFESGIEKICKKIGEESAETIIEAVRDNKERLIYESADLIYHLMVLLKYRGISIEMLEKELYSREGNERL